MNHDDPITSTNGKNRRAWLLAGTGLGVVVLTATAVGIATLGGTDRSDATATGEAFANAVATSDSQACELATPGLAAQLRGLGRCDDADRNAQVQVLFSTPCATRGLAGVQITPALEPGKPYALIGLARDEQGEWSAASLLPLADRAAVQGGVCEASTDGGE